MRSEQFLEGLNYDRLCKQLAECAVETQAISVFTMVNESTGATTHAYQINEAGIKDYFEKGKDMLLDPIRKGAIKADELKDKIVAKLGKEQSGKVMQAAKRFGKPALAFLLIGGAMMGGMGDVQASELMPGDMPDAHGAGMDQAPDAAMQQFQDIDMGKVKDEFIRTQIGSVEYGGHKITPDQVDTALSSMKVNGVPFDDYLKRAVLYAMKNELSIDGMMQMIGKEVDQFDLLNAVKAEFQKT